MPQKLRARLLGIALLTVGTLGFGQNIHIHLRSMDSKTWFHLGEPVTLEAACIDSITGQYLEPCVVVLKPKSVSPGSRLSADRIDQTTWEDAQAGALPPEPRAGCGNLDNPMPSKASGVATWHKVTLEEPFPAYVGQYKIGAELAVDLERAERFGETEKHSTSDEVEVGLDDNLGWRDRLIAFHNCDYDVRLTLTPDREAIRALIKHLDDCAVEDDRSLIMMLHEIVWLKMQVEKPQLYSRMLALEHTRLPFRKADEAELQKTELEQARLSAKSDTKLITTWFHDQYRELLLETARELVLAYKSHPELRSDEDFGENLEIGFQNWHDAAATLAGGANSYVSIEQVTSYLKQAGRSHAYIVQFMTEEKDNLPMELPTYSYRDISSE